MFYLHFLLYSAHWLFCFMLYLLSISFMIKKLLQWIGIIIMSISSLLFSLLILGLLWVFLTMFTISHTEKEWIWLIISSSIVIVIVILIILIIFIIKKSKFRKWFLWTATGIFLVICILYYFLLWKWTPKNIPYPAELFTPPQPISAEMQTAEHNWLVALKELMDTVPK